MTCPIQGGDLSHPACYPGTVRHARPVVVAVWAIWIAGAQGARAQDAGPDASRDAAPNRPAEPAIAASPVEPAELLAWKQDRNRRLRGEIAALEGRTSAIAELSPETVKPASDLADLFAVDLDSPAAVAHYLVALNAARRSLEIAARDLALLADALAKKAVEPTSGRRGRRQVRDNRSAEDIALAAARLENIALERAKLRALIALARAKGDFLDRSQPERQRRTELARDDGQKEIAEQSELSQKIRREAERARDEALSEQRQAQSRAAALINAERARLEGVRGELARQRNNPLLSYRSEIHTGRSRLEAFYRELRGELDDRLPGSPANRARYWRIVGEQTRVEDTLLSCSLDALPGREVPSPGARLSRAVRNLPDSYAAKRDELDSLRQTLTDQAAKLALELPSTAWQCAELFSGQASELNDLRLAAFEQLSRDELDRLSGLTGDAADALLSEAVHVASRAVHWANRRYHQLRDADSFFGDLSAVAAALWWLIEIALVLLFLRSVLRRWDRWMLVCVEAVGTSMHLDNWTMFLVRLADSARNFGPSLVVLAAAVFVFHRLGGESAPPEIQLVYVFVLWSAVFRFQLRLVHSAAHYFGLRAAEQSADSRENSGDPLDASDPDNRPVGARAKAARVADRDAKAAIKTDPSAAVTLEGTLLPGRRDQNEPTDQRRSSHKRPTPRWWSIAKSPAADHRYDNTPYDDDLYDDTPPAPVSELAVRTWRIVSGYAATVVILLDLARLAIGPAVLFHWVAGLAWWGALLLAVYCLRLWRTHIVDACTENWAEDSPSTHIVRRHSSRFYGVVVVAVALVITLARRLVSVGKRIVLNLGATRSVLSFVFRRRVERHAAEHGRVLDKPHSLPDQIVDQFPTGPLGPGDRPFKPAFLDDIRQAFTTWQDDRVEGTVVLVGGAGMGKSTGLDLLERALGEPVLKLKLRDKYTDAEALVAGLARLFEVSQQTAGRPGKESEAELLRSGAAGRPAIRSDDDSASGRLDESELITRITAKLAKEERCIVAVDNCHNLFLRKVGGFAAWEAFTRIVSASCENIFWVLTFDSTAWDYLSNIAAGVSYFRRVLHIPPWNDTDLRRMILTRMRRAGYRTNFTDLLVTRLEGVNTATQIVRTSQGYFRLLCDFTDGNPRLACHFWLRSLVPDPQKRRVRVHLFASPRIEELEKLPDDIAFVLTAVVEHENMTASELVTVSNLPEQFCRFALRYCRDRGYMWRSPRTGRTKLSVHWQQPIIRYLKRKNLLYS
ncbi:MAG: hypothetical protein MJE77_08860 [Proteobacteria bacterium]|nr:hypothetical protein [Pseudomonadota bacterium]